MFSEENTYENLLESVLENAPAGIDTRQGSIFYDAVAGVILKIAKLYADIDMISDLVYIDTTTGEYLDRKAAEQSMSRLPATYCCYNFSYTGTQPEIGERFYADGQYFTLCKTGNTLYLKAETPGTAANAIYSGTAAVPANNIPGLTSATFGSVMELGADEESDDDLRDRLREKISGPAENGNRQNYRSWCESVEGVGRARIIPLWDGPNTVKGIIISPSGTPCTSTVVARVQDYIDPDDDEDGEGDGLGEGVANLGAHFTAVAPTECEIDISFNAVLTAGATSEEAAEQVETAVTDYLKNLTLDTPDGEAVVVRVSSVGALINGLSSILDYNTLKLNNATDNIEPGDGAVAVIGEVTINVL